MNTIKTSITLPQDLYEEAKKTSDNFSALVAAALQEYMRKRTLEKAISSFGQWEEREGESIDIVNQLRAEAG